MNKIIYNCAWCGKAYEPRHGNSRHCCDEHEVAARKRRQRKRYNAISPLLPLIIENHEVLDRLFQLNQPLYTAAELENEGLDFSLFRRLYPKPENREIIWLDFGKYYLETSDNFLTFKLSKHETQPRQSRRPAIDQNK
jgi:hypothetical protein